VERMITDSFAETAAFWKDDPEHHDTIIHEYDKAVAECKPLKDFREWVEINKFGYGHRSFIHAWRLFVKECPNNFKFLELGVFKGQAIAAVALCSILEQKQCQIYAVSPFKGDGFHYEFKDYKDDVNLIFKRWAPQIPYCIIEGQSLDEHVLEKVTAEALFDGIYIDSDHIYEVTSKELPIYTKLIKPGGFLFIDDCIYGFNTPEWFFKGFQGSTDAVDEVLPPKTKNDEFDFITNIMHMRIYRKKK